MILMKTKQYSGDTDNTYPWRNRIMQEKPRATKLPVVGVFLFTISVLLVFQYNQYMGEVYQHFLANQQRFLPVLENFFGNGNDKDATVRQQTTFKNGTKLVVNKWKTVLFWSSWFGGDWMNRFGPHTPEELRELGCPIWQCNFTSNRSVLRTADAVIVESSMFGSLKSKKYERPNYQRWIWVNVEAPGAGKPQNITLEAIKWNPSFLINWTMTYHSNADIVAFYGHFKAINASQMPVLPHMMSSFPETMRTYSEDIASGITISDIMGIDWKQKLNKRKIVAWMSGHCPTASRREAYIRELSRHIEIDTYGRCGKMKCTNRNVFIDHCWTEILSQYSFYMAMENSLCSDYITEKLYLPMISYIVPVVWGDANYSQYLPPDSYIDARQYHPKDLATLLKDLHDNPLKYSKYHLWRGYWNVHRGGSFCQLCYRLHTDIQLKHYYDIKSWRLTNGKCINAPKDMFDKEQRPDYWQRFLEDHNSTMI